MTAPRVRGRSANRTVQQGSFAWTPNTVGTYAIQAWARQSGSSAPYETWRGTGYLDVTQGPARIGP